MAIRIKLIEKYFCIMCQIPCLLHWKLLSQHRKVLLALSVPVASSVTVGVVFCIGCHMWPGFTCYFWQYLIFAFNAYSAVDHLAVLHYRLLLGCQFATCADNQSKQTVEINHNCGMCARLLVILLMQDGPKMYIF